MDSQKIKVSYAPYRLYFKEPVGTSRGILKEKITYFLRIVDSNDSSRVGYGEVPFFPGLSCESQEEVECALKMLTQVKSSEETISFKALSSVAFGIEQAMLSLEEESGNALIFPSAFTEGKREITINGLIWMGDFRRMMQRLEDKLEEGFHCIKLKIGAIDWDEEIKLIASIRGAGGDCLTIRVDANGAFHPSDCLWRLEKLAELGVHSIEQPIRQGQAEELKRICMQSPLPIALDEELIGLFPDERRSEMLNYISPQFLILKPALCYGFSGASDWIERARQLGIGWWITSALESSVGLNAIAQFTATLSPELPQGLGTGNLYTNNFPSPLLLKGDVISYRGPADIYKDSLETLPWISE